MNKNEELENARVTIASLAELAACQQRVIQQLAHPLVETSKPGSWNEMLFFKAPEKLKAPYWLVEIMELASKNLAARPRSTYLEVKSKDLLKIGDYVEGLLESINKLREERQALTTGIKVPLS